MSGQDRATEAQLTELVNRAAAGVRLGEEPEWPDWLHGKRILGLLELLRRVRARKALLEVVRKEVKAIILARLDGGAVSDGHTLYRAAPTGERLIRDPVELLSWLGPDAAGVLKLRSADDSVRITAFRQIAEQRCRDAMRGEVDDDLIRQSVAAIEGHLFEEVPGTEMDLNELPLDSNYAPRYAATMEPGEIRPARRRQ